MLMSDCHNDCMPSKIRNHVLTPTVTGKNDLGTTYAKNIPLGIPRSAFVNPKNFASLPIMMLPQQKK